MKTAPLRGFHWYTGNSVKNKALQLIGDEVIMRTETISKNMQDQMKSDLQKCVWFFLQRNESSDMPDN